MRAPNGRAMIGANRNWLPRPSLDSIGKILTAASPFTP